MQRLRGSDAYAIYSETPTSPFVTLKVVIYKPTRDNDTPAVDEIKGFIKRCIKDVGATRAGLGIVRVPLDLHHPVWVQIPGFSPDNHIHEAELPAPGDKAQLCDFLSDLVARPMDHRRPLWDVWVLSGLEGGRMAIAFRVHHALADGKTVVKLIERGHSRVPAAEAPEAEIPADEPLPGKPRLVRDALVDLAKSYTLELPGYYRHLKQARRKGAAIREAAGKLVAPFSAPFTIFNAKAGGSERIYRYETFRLSDFKALARHFDCTINTILMGACSEALRRYLQEMDALPSESLITAMPVGEQAGSGLDRLLNSDIHNNNLAVAIVPLYQNIAGFGERLQAIKEAAQAAIDHVRHQDGRRFDNYLDFMPGTAIRMINDWTTKRQKKKQRPYANVVISNVPGPRETLYALDGRLELEELLSAGNLMDQGNINITVWSYVDKLAFSFLFRKDALPRPERLVDHLRDVVHELKSSHTVSAG